jgi:hypothetical protein
MTKCTFMAEVLLPASRTQHVGGERGRWTGAPRNMHYSTAMCVIRSKQLPFYKMATAILSSVQWRGQGQEIKLRFGHYKLLGRWTSDCFPPTHPKWFCKLWKQCFVHAWRWPELSTDISLLLNFQLLKLRIHTSIAVLREVAPYDMWADKIWSLLMCILPSSRYKLSWKLNLSHYTPWRRLGERTYRRYSLPTSTLDGDEWSTSRPGCALAPGKGPPVPIA